LHHCILFSSFHSKTIPHVSLIIIKNNNTSSLMFKCMYSFVVVYYTDW
jgi:hypothetical protein